MSGIGFNIALCLSILLQQMGRSLSRPPLLLYAVYNSHDLHRKYPFLAVRFQIYFIFQDFLLVSMTGLHGAVPGVNDNTWADDCKKIKYTSLMQC